MMSVIARMARESLLPPSAITVPAMPHMSVQTPAPGRLVFRLGQRLWSLLRHKLRFLYRQWALALRNKAERRDQTRHNGNVDVVGKALEKCHRGHHQECGLQHLGHHADV